MNLRDLIRLGQLARRRLASERDYRQFQAFQAQQLIQYLADHGMALAGRPILDLGSGLGGYSREFAAHGARVFSLDLVAQRHLRLAGVAPVQGNSLRLPLRDHSLERIFCASLIEHVAQPEHVLFEIERVLTVGGLCYLSFPPYYSPVGGHEFAPFHYLGEKMALRLVRRRAVVPAWVYEFYQLPEQLHSFADTAAGWGLYKMTIRKFRRLLADTRLAVVNASTRYLPVSFIRWPGLGELLTWHAQFILVKRA